MLHHHKCTNESREKCDLMCHRSVNHSNRAGIYLNPGAILDFSKGTFAWGEIHYERLPLCHVLQTLLFFFFVLLILLLNRGLVFHLSKNIFLLLLREEIFMTEQVSTMARGLVFAGCLSVPFYIFFSNACSLFFTFSLQNLQG